MLYVLGRLRLELTKDTYISTSDVRVIVRGTYAHASTVAQNIRIFLLTLFKLPFFVDGFNSIDLLSDRPMGTYNILIHRHQRAWPLNTISGDILQLDIRIQELDIIG